ncbi:MAG: hypothetical protein LEGION0403_FIIPPAGN_01697 [Legionella sp.]
MHMTRMLLIALTINTSLYAQDVKIVGTIDKYITVAKNTKTLQNPAAAKTYRSIKLLKVELSKPAERALANRARRQITSSKNRFSSSSSLPKKIELGMNDVPVLDQGSFGTCVTFSITAAIDAVLGKGDYISQLCQLQLGNYLESNGYNPSGWNGSNGRNVLNQMNAFGVVSKTAQEAFGCGGLNNYPKQFGDAPTSFITPEEYHKLSEPINQVVDWLPILDITTAFNRVDTNIILNEVKKALKEQDRVIFGVLLVDFEPNIIGAVGSHNSHYDSWILTPEIARELYIHHEFGAHEMIITGYDDDAVALDDQGHEHKGLLTLRNSWGTSEGDKGDFYMSYDYFKVLVIEARRIRHLEDQPDADDVDSFTS